MTNLIEYGRIHGTLNGLKVWDCCVVIYEGVNKETFGIMNSICYGRLQEMHLDEVVKLFLWFPRDTHKRNRLNNDSFDVPNIEPILHEDYPPPLDFHSNEAHSHDNVTHEYSHDFLHHCMNVNYIPHVSNVNAQIEDIRQPINPFMCYDVIDDDDDYNSCFAKDDDRISEGNDIEEVEVLNFELPFSSTSPPLSESKGMFVGDIDVNVTFEIPP